MIGNNSAKFEKHDKLVTRTATGIIAVAGIAVVGLLCLGGWGFIELVQWVVSK